MKKSDSIEVSPEQINQYMQAHRGAFGKGFHSTEEAADAEMSHKFAAGQGIGGTPKGLHRTKIPAEMLMTILPRVKAAEAAKTNKEADKLTLGL